MFTFKTDVSDLVTLQFEPAREGVLSWNTFSESGAISFRLLRAGVAATQWLQHVQWSREGRQSFSPQHEDVRVDIDVIGSTQPFDGIEVRATDVEFNLIGFATPVHNSPSLPYIGEARILEDWAGLRPGTPDGLPVLGRTEVDAYYVATGHYRDGILLAPITAKLMSRLIRGQDPELDISHFRLNRFQASETRQAK